MSKLGSTSQVWYHEKIISCVYYVQFVCWEQTEMLCSKLSKSSISCVHATYVTKLYWTLTILDIDVSRVYWYFLWCFFCATVYVCRVCDQQVCWNVITLNVMRDLKMHASCYFASEYALFHLPLHDKSNIIVTRWWSIGFLCYCLCSASTMFLIFVFHHACQLFVQHNFSMRSWLACVFWFPCHFTKGLRCIWCSLKIHTNPNIYLGKKKSRRLKRAKKAKEVGPSPADGPLRSIVRCPTQRHNRRVRAGRGFTLAELREAKIGAKLARTIGIAVDPRRTNRSVQAFQKNVARLREYKAALVVFPTKNQKRKAKSGTTKTASASYSTYVDVAQEAGLDVPSVDTRKDIFTIAQDPAGRTFEAITSELWKRFLRETADGEKGTAYQTLRHTWATAHNVGRKFKPKEEKGSKKKKKWFYSVYLSNK